MMFTFHAWHRIMFYEFIFVSYLGWHKIKKKVIIIFFFFNKISFKKINYYYLEQIEFNFFFMLVLFLFSIYEYNTRTVSEKKLVSQSKILDSITCLFLNKLLTLNFLMAFLIKNNNIFKKKKNMILSYIH